jgi:succinate-semialdehyde dehydrogenase/glutarate-semialdehyde dehydrogenase
MMIQAINPTTGEVLKTYEEMAPAMVTAIVRQTHEAFLGWRRTTFSPLPPAAPALIDRL